MNRRIRASTAGHWLSIAVLSLTVPWLGCATQNANPQSTPQAIQAVQEIPLEELLDVGITVFDPGLPPEGQPAPDDVFPELRKAEARYQAIRLMDTMQSTGQWGAVRVLPAGHGFTDLRVSGRIVQSTGHLLELDIRAVDARGVEWLDKRYHAAANELAYTGAGVEQGDPFQSIYNQISNDLLEKRRKLRLGEAQEIRQVARLRFAADIAPEPFQDYLKTDKKGHIGVRRLPSRDDPMITRIDTIRASENLFVDTLDQNYATFYARMEAPYASWRKYTFEEETAYRALKRKAMMQKILGGLAILGAALADVDSRAASVARDMAMIGGMAAIHSGIATSKEAKIHAEAIRELAGSVETELAPIVVEVRGQTLRLTGSATTQYEEWRRLMREFWVTETGLPVDPNRPGAATVEIVNGGDAPEGPVEQR